MSALKSCCATQPRPPRRSVGRSVARVVRVVQRAVDAGARAARRRRGLPLRPRRRAHARPRRSTPRRGSEMFDDYLRERAATGETSRRSTPATTTTSYVDGKPRYDGVRSFLRVARHRRCRRARPTTRPAPRPSTAWATARTSSCSSCIERDGVEVYEGSVRYVRAARDAGLRRAVVSSSANCRDVLEAAGHRATCSRSASTASSPSARACAGKPAPDTFLAGARGARRGARRRRRCSRTRSPGVEAGRAGGFGCVVGVDRVGARRRAARRTAPTSSSTTSPSCWSERMIEHPRFASSPWAVRETELDLDAARPDASRCSRSSNGHIGLRGNLDEGEPAGAARHVPQRLLRDPPAAVRRGRLRQPRGGPDDHQRHRRQAHPAARRRRAVRRPLRRARSSHERVLDFRAGVLRRDVEWRSPAGSTSGCRSTRLVSFAQRVDRRDPLRGRAASTGAVRDRRAVRARRQRARAGAATDDPRAAAALAAPLVGRAATGTTSCARCSCTARAQRAADGGGDGPRGRRARTARSTDVESRARPRPRHDRRRARSPASSCGS